MPEQHPLVLIADRDQKVRELQEYFLGKAGLRVDFADDGVAALERAQAIRPALVVTEILIPKLDGLALCRRLREDPATSATPVLVFSILAAAGRAHEAGATRFLYYRSDDVAAVPGVGLGLAISRALVQQMGGQLLLESEVARGSSFIIRLPMAS